MRRSVASWIARSPRREGCATRCPCPTPPDATWSSCAGGDARRALTALEAAAAVAYGEATDRSGAVEITEKHTEEALDKAALRYDKGGDQHYDVISAFIKSIRGSDVDAALHYLARMIEAGEDPRFIARRLVVHASEDIGMADPTAFADGRLPRPQAVQLIGLPEARINLAQGRDPFGPRPRSPTR
jgi:putative ATPase